MYQTQWRDVNEEWVVGRSVFATPDDAITVVNGRSHAFKRVFFRVVRLPDSQNPWQVVAGWYGGKRVF